MLLLQMISVCCKWKVQMILARCKWVCKWLAHDFKTCSWLLQMTNGFAHGKCKWLLMDNFALVTTMWQKIFLWDLKLFTWFLVQKKAEISYFTIQKFFTPLTSFLPHFFDNEHHTDFWNFDFYCFWRLFIWKKLG